MKKVLIWVVALMTTGLLHGQEYKVAKSTGRLEVHVGKVTFEGYSGNEIIFSSSDPKREGDERAKGLKPINSMGLDDNTGMGINVTEKGDVISVNQLNKTNTPAIIIKVPKGIIVSFEYMSQHGGKVRFVNMENEIEVSAQYNGVQLENVTGPLTIETVYGQVEATFGANVKGPISIVSVYGFVDVAIPVTTKANLKLETSYGQIFVAPEFKIEIGAGHDEDNLTGKINGGGTNVELTCSYGKVYLRKK